MEKLRKRTCNDVPVTTLDQSGGIIDPVRECSRQLMLSSACLPPKLGTCRESQLFVHFLSSGQILAQSQRGLSRPSVFETMIATLRRAHFPELRGNIYKLLSIGFCVINQFMTEEHV